MEYIIERAVAIIREKFQEPLTLDELAKAVMVSKFHFLRSFRRTTGVTPGRFLSAVRLAEAEFLLRGTSLKVSDICAEVGYNSIGSFTRRFTDSVGLAPTQYRQTWRSDAHPFALALPSAGGAPGTVAGTVQLPHAKAAQVFVGLFDSPILQGRPVASALCDAPGTFRLTGIPNGTWYLHAAVLPERTHTGRPFPDGARPTQLVDCTGPLAFKDGDPACAERLEQLCLTLRPAEWFRPPVLLALPYRRPCATLDRETPRPLGTRPTRDVALVRGLRHAG
jgi:AraC-like DNA-binding protein